MLTDEEFQVGQMVNTSPVEEVERKIREAIFKAKEIGLTIASDGFGVISRAVDAFWTVAKDHRVCPLGAVLLNYKAVTHPHGGDPWEDAALLLGIKDEEAHAFTKGFDLEHDPTGGPFYDLGRKLRKELEYHT